MKKNKISPQKISQLRSFIVAFQGLKELFCSQRNFRFHIFASFIALVCCFFFEVKPHEWIAVLFLIAMILSVEALNTSIEYICDMISPEYHPLIKKIKDVAAAAVLLCAIISVVIGCIIFIPYIIRFI